MEREPIRVGRVKDGWVRGRKEAEGRRERVKERLRCDDSLRCVDIRLHRGNKLSDTEKIMGRGGRSLL